MIAIDTMTVLAGDSRKAAEAIKWAEGNTALLCAEWIRLNRRGSR